MHRCYIAPSNWELPELVPDQEELHHLLDVLRAGGGDAVEVFDGRGRVATATLRTGGRESRRAGRSREAVLTLDESPRMEPPDPVAITLLQAVPKGKRLDLVVEKATELGAARIIPVLTERCVVSLDAEGRRERLERWRRIVLSAGRQCGAAWLPEVMLPAGLDEALALVRGADLLLVGSLGPRTRPLCEVLRSTARPREVAMLIGPEGDLTPAELTLACAAGAREVTFGRRVLRTETAGLYSLSVLACEYLSGA